MNPLFRHSPTAIADDIYRRSAVCIPLVQTERGLEVLFEVRSSKIPDQPGDICFPGGMMEENETPQESAVREMCEELLVAPQQIEVLGATDYYHTQNLVIYPFLTVLHDYDGSFSEDEAAEVFTVPLDFFLHTEPERHTMERVAVDNDEFPYHLIYGGRNYRWRKMITTELFYLYQDRVIWGITARILYAMTQMLNKEELFRILDC